MAFCLFFQPPLWPVGRGLEPTLAEAEPDPPPGNLPFQGRHRLSRDRVTEEGLPLLRLPRSLQEEEHLSLWLQRRGELEPEGRPRRVRGRQ